MDHKKETLFEALNLNDKDYKSFLDSLNKTLREEGFEKVGETFENLTMENKQDYFSLFVFSILDKTLEISFDNFMMDRVQKDLNIGGSPKIIKESLLSISGFVQVIDNDNPIHKALSLFISITPLIANVSVPNSMIIKMFIEIIDFLKLPYNDIISGLGIYLEVIDPAGIKDRGTEH